MPPRKLASDNVLSLHFTTKPGLGSTGLPAILHALQAAGLHLRVRHPI
jgi:hypothetical protein